MSSELLEQLQLYRLDVAAMAESARKNPGSFGFTVISTPCRDFMHVWQKEPCVRYKISKTGEKLETVRAPLVEDAVLMV